MYVSYMEIMTDPEERGEEGEKQERIERSEDARKQDNSQLDLLMASLLLSCFSRVNE